MAWWCRRQTDQAWRAIGDRAGSGKATSRSRRASGTLRGTSGASRSSPRGWAPPLCLAPQVFNAARFKVDMARYPTIQRIHANCMKHPAFDAAQPSRQPDAEP